MKSVPEKKSKEPPQCFGTLQGVAYVTTKPATIEYFDY
jgi:hypothetical protein